MSQNVETKATVEVTAAPKKPFVKSEGKPFVKTEGKKEFSKGPRKNNGPRRERMVTEFEERVVNIARVTNVVKGGRRFSFAALVVIGDKKGTVAYGHGKAKEVPEAIKKAVRDARRNLVKLPIVNGTVPHISQAKFVSSNVLVKPAPKGKGIIASGSVRAVVELAGYTDIVTKSLGSSNKQNTVKATIKALSQLKTAKEIADMRDKDEKHFA